MTERGERLLATAEHQIAELIALVSTVDDLVLREQCSGREKLGDGTVAANARHAADNYERIASFVTAAAMLPEARSARLGGPTGPGARQAASHGSGQHGEGGATAGPHGRYSAANFDRSAVIEQLSTTSVALTSIAELTDGQLDAVPGEGSFRFCDGQRTLERVLASLLRHQRHQLDALKSA